MGDLDRGDTGTIKQAAVGEVPMLEKGGDNRSPSLTTGSRSIPGQARGTHEDPRSQNVKPDPYYYIFFEAF